MLVLAAGQIIYRPWYAAVWGRRPCSTDVRMPKPVSSEPGTRRVPTPIASAMVERAAAFVGGDRRAVENLAAGRAAIVVTMVTDTDAVISIARDQGMLAALAPGAIWVQMSTIVAGIDRVIALVAADRPDVTLLDAPVSGRT